MLVVSLVCSSGNGQGSFSVLLAIEAAWRRANCTTKKKNATKPKRNVALRVPRPLLAIKIPQRAYQILPPFFLERTADLPCVRGVSFFFGLDSISEPRREASSYRWKVWGMARQTMGSQQQLRACCNDLCSRKEEKRKKAIHKGQ